MLQDGLHAVSKETLNEIDSNIEIDNLYQSLNKFIILINDDNNSLDKPNSAKKIANFLRLNILSYLRQEDKFFSGEYDEEKRVILIQWWVTLLNFSNSDVSKFADELAINLYDVEVLSVCLECISRILTKSLYLLTKDPDNIEIFSHHILITIHYVTNRLILSSKYLRDPKNNTKENLKVLNKYNYLLRSILGKLNAFAFFALPDSFNFDIQLMLEIEPNMTFEPSKTSFFWKNRKFYGTKDSKKIVDAKSIDTEDLKFFKIIISYLKNDIVFNSFYWHYWHIVITFLSKDNNLESSLQNLDNIPGAEILLKYVTCSFMNLDLFKLKSFLNSKLKKRGDSNGNASINLDVNESMPDSDIDLDGQFPCRKKTNKPTPVSDQEYNNFIFYNFRSLKIWECLRSLTSTVGPIIQPVLQLHDKEQLRYISHFSAYDSPSSNIIYNKLLQYILFQFGSIKSLEFVNWEHWCRGIFMMLNTSSIKCQVIGIISLFNIWKYIPTAYISILEERLIYDYWDDLSENNEYPLSQLLYVRLVVFKVLKTKNKSLKLYLRNKFETFNQAVFTFADQNPEFNYKPDNSLLSYNGNKNFAILSNKQNSERDLLIKLKEYNERNTKSGHPVLFPSILNIVKSRVSFVLLNGKYPYDVIDVLSSRSEVVSVINGSSDDNLHTLPKSSDSIVDKSTESKSGNLSSTVNSFFSNFSSSMRHFTSQETNANDQEKDQVLKQRIIPPPEFKASNDITTNKGVLLVMKPVLFRPGTLLSRIDDANKKWNVVTARTYDKPLPIPKDDKVDKLVKEISAMGLRTQSNLKFPYNNLYEDPFSINELHQEANENDMTLPQVDLNIFSSKPTKGFDEDTAFNLQDKNKLSCNTIKKDRILLNNINPKTIYIEDSDESCKQKLITKEKNKNNYKINKFKKLYDFLYIFNNTVMQYYETQKLLNEDTLFLEFEVRENFNI